MEPSNRPEPAPADRQSPRPCIVRIAGPDRSSCQWEADGNLICLGWQPHLSYHSLLNIPRVPPGIARSNFVNVLFRDLFGLLQRAEDREFGTDQTAQPAVNTIISSKYQFRRMVALFVEMLALSETAVGTELYTEAATLAAGLNDMHVTMRNRVILRIQRESPEFHLTNLRTKAPKLS